MQQIARQRELPFAPQQQQQRIAIGGGQRVTAAMYARRIVERLDGDDPPLLRR